jgi:hypothetical protein
VLLVAAAAMQQHQRRLLGAVWRALQLLLRVLMCGGMAVC